MVSNIISMPWSSFWQNPSSLRNFMWISNHCVYTNLKFFIFSLYENQDAGQDSLKLVANTHQQVYSKQTRSECKNNIVKGHIGKALWLAVTIIIVIVSSRIDNIKVKLHHLVFTHMQIPIFLFISIHMAVPKLCTMLSRVTF